VYLGLGGNLIRIIGSLVRIFSTMRDDHHGGNAQCIEIGCGVILIELWGEKGCESVTEWVLFFYMVATGDLRRLEWR